MNKIFTIIYYNRFACENQTVDISAKNKFKACRLFYKLYPRKSYYKCIESVTIRSVAFYTERDINALVAKRKENE